MAVFGAAVLVALAVTCGLIWSRSRRLSKEMRDIPGTMGWPVVGETFSFISGFSSPAGILSFMRDRQKRFGKVFKTYVLGRMTVFMTGREAAKILLSGKDGVVSLNLFYTGKQVLGPTSLLTTNGDEHKKLRRLIGEPLSIDALKKHFDFINDLAVQTLDTWLDRRVLVLEEASSVIIKLFTLKVIANMLISLEPEGEEQEKFRANFKIISSSFASLPLKIPGTAFHRGLKKARNRMYAMLDSVIARRRDGGEVRNDFLQTLLRKHAKDGTAADEDDGGGGGDRDADKLTDAQLKDNILTLLVAGHDTTTAGLTWLIKFLGENPEALQKLRVMNETLRRATILPWFSRKAAQDFSIDGYEIKKGTSVNLDVVSIHHDPSVFADPYKFDPNRFDGTLKPYSFLGFGSGPRMCPGMSLARLEICVFIHHLVCRYSTPAGSQEIKQQELLRGKVTRNSYFSGKCDKEQQPRSIAQIFRSLKHDHSRAVTRNGTIQEATQQQQLRKGQGQWNNNQVAKPIRVTKKHYARQQWPSHAKPHMID
ncbi:Os03g0836100 [Oryza sativa Japonica Group]|uniref:Cytochrome P450 n=2 Tax=Oryza sativa subsp. japonica TaxID=39947 RepID=Q10AZ3_ORYSJ|nr:putative cytochrome P450 [Oryza sativa Japonica Group]ABF99755.1 Cytochrome P450 family protein, expressed [Oryza sativa Japonica Group]BAH92431.1 Os03g0836100 [Oryza sativa Japonica Group]|eukprot:NP_001173703.1 Os03g0836100 [Oryza sativa Japonica Group]